GLGDDVVISQPGFDTITLLSAQSVNSLNCDETLQINSGGQLSLAADSQIGGTLTLNGGTLAGAGNVTIGGTFNWSGTLAAGGKTTLAAGSITTVGGAVLSRVLENAGIMNFTPANSVVPMNFAGGTLNNLVGGTFNFSVGSAGSPNTIMTSQGT